MMASCRRLPRRAGDAHVLVLDVHGTVMIEKRKGGRLPYHDAEALDAALQPNMPVVQQALSYQESGHVLRFSSGGGENLREVTIQQLTECGFRRVEDVLDLHGYQSVDQLVNDKADHLRDWNAVAIVGDSRSIDGAAARKAGVAWINPGDFALGLNMAYTWCWRCGTPAPQLAPGVEWVNERVCGSCVRPHDHRLPFEVLA